jgi:hypothetical protein
LGKLNIATINVNLATGIIENIELVQFALRRALN